MGATQAERKREKQGRPPRDRLEKKLRTVAWYNDVARRLGASNPFQTAKAFGNQYAGSWNKYATGEVEPGTWLALVEVKCPGAHRTYEHGPGFLWDAIWCDEADLWKGCYIDSDPVKRPRWRELFEKLVGKLGHVDNEAPLVSREISLERAIENFQGWFSARYVSSKEAVDLRALGLAIRLYRTRSIASRFAGVEAEGIYECIKACLSCPTVQTELSEYGVLALMIELIEGWERQRIMRDWQHRHLINILGTWCGIDDPVSSYIGNPLRFSALVATK